VPVTQKTDTHAFMRKIGWLSDSSDLLSQPKNSHRRTRSGAEAPDKKIKRTKNTKKVNHSKKVSTFPPKNGMPTGFPPFDNKQQTGASASNAPAVANPVNKPKKSPRTREVTARRMKSRSHINSNWKPPA
jgi:hypothetical protein